MYKKNSILNFINQLKDNYSDIFIILLIFSSSTGFILYPINSLSNFATIFNVLTFVLLFLWFVFSFIMALKNKRSLFYFLIPLIFSFVTLVIQIVANKASFFSYYKEYVTFLGPFLYMFLLINCKFSKVTIRCLAFVLFLLDIFFIALLIYNIPSNLSFTDSVFGFSNPNMTGLFVSYLGMMNIYFLLSFKKSFLKISCLLISLSCFSILYFTKSRDFIISYAFSIFYFLVFVFFKDSFKKNLVVSLVITITPIVFASVYFCFFAVKNDFLPYSLESMTSVGKSVETRYTIWCESFILIREHLFTGDIKWFGNLHNSSIFTLGSFGLIVFIMTLLCIFLFICCTISSLKIRTSSFANCFAALFLFTTLLYGIAESAPLYSTNCFFVMYLLPSLLVRIPVNKNIWLENDVSIETGKKKVLYINNVYSLGSTGKLVQMCHVENIKEGKFESFVIYGRKKKPPYRNVVCVEDWLEVLLTKLLRKLLHSQTFGNVFMTQDIIEAIKALKPDVIHIHGVNDHFVNFKTLFKFLSKRKIKVVYTNHSEWLYLGDCGGNSFDCNMYKTEECINCPKKRTTIGKIISHRNYTLKKTIMSSFEHDKLIITSVSPFINGRSKDSGIFGSFDNHMIMNGIDVYSELGKGYNNKDFLNKFKLLDERPYLLFVVPSILNKNKGFDYLLKISALLQNIPFVVVSYNCSSTIDNNVYYFNNINNLDELYCFYHYAAATLILSKQETFSMPLIESLTNGTKVIGFKAGGPESIGLSGYCSFTEYGDIESIVTEINKILLTNYDKELVASVSRDNYSFKKMYYSYCSLYKL